jgi:hypothetical protein
MKNVCVLLVAAIAALSGTFPRHAMANEIDIDSDSFAAIAYSPSTGEFHYACNYSSRWAAQEAALALFKAKDGRVVCWVNEGFCALALGDDQSVWGTGWRFGDGASNADAMNTALEQCKKRTTGAHIVLCVSSDGQYIYKPQPRVAAKPTGSVKEPLPGASTQPPASTLPRSINPDPMQTLAPSKK